MIEEETRWKHWVFFSVQFKMEVIRDKNIPLYGE